MEWGCSTKITVTWEGEVIGRWFDALSGAARWLTANEIGKPEDVLEVWRHGRAGVRDYVLERATIGAALKRFVLPGAVYLRREDYLLEVGRHPLAHKEAGEGLITETLAFTKAEDGGLSREAKAYLKMQRSGKTKGAARPSHATDRKEHNHG